MKSFTRILSYFMIIVMFVFLFSGINITNVSADERFNTKNGYFEYKVEYNNKITITNYSGTDTKLDIPSKIDGKSVTSIGLAAFSYCSLTSITIPNSVESIGDSAFSYCSLTSITIPNSITSIGDNAFSYCSNLTNISVNKENKCFSSENGILFNKDKSELRCYPCGKKDESYIIPNSVTSIGDYAFIYCISLRRITIPNSITSIGDSAFSFCNSLTSITIPNSVKSIGENVFIGCSSLRSIILPNSITSIGDNAFSYCSSLTNISVNKENKCFSSENGILFNKDKSELRCYPCGKKDESYIIPNSVKSIVGYAFNCCNSLRSITIPNSVISIGDSAFRGCNSLRSITIPNSVTSIGDNAFSGCNNLTIYGYKNSYAETYAKKNSKPFNTIDESYIYVDDNSIMSLEVPNKITCEVGTEFSNLPLPKNLKVKTKGGKEYQLNVQWNEENYDKNRAGNYKIKGTFNLSDNLNNNSFLEPLIIVSVTDSYGVSLNNSNNNGSNIDINKPSSDNPTKIKDLKNINLSSGNYKLEGNINYKGNLKIGAEITIPKGFSLNVSGNVILKKGGKINVEGTLNCSNLDLNESNMWVDGALNAKNITINGAFLGELARLDVDGSINASGNMNIKSYSTLHMNKGSKMVIYGDFNSGGYCHLNGGDLWVGGNFIHNGEKKGLNGEKNGLNAEKGHNLIIFGEGTGWLNKTHKIKFNSKEAKIYNLYVEEDRLNSISGEYMDNVQGEAYLVNVNTSYFTFSKKKKISSFNKNKQELYKQFEKASLYTDQYAFNDPALNDILTKESIEDLKKMIIVWDALSSSDIMKKELGSYYSSCKQKCTVNVKTKDGKYVKLIITINKMGSSGMFTSNSSWKIPSLNKEGVLTVSAKVNLNQFCNAINKYLKKELIGEFVGDFVNNKLEKMLGDLLNEGLKDMCSELTGMVFDVVYDDLTSKSMSLDSIEETDNGSVNTKEISNSLFNDSNLEKAIRENLGLFNNEELTKEQLKNIISLDLSSKDISDLSGIENLSSLTSLSLNDNFIEDLSPISELINLQFLDLGDNAISSIKDISKLTKLTYLDISNNFIEDISGISNMKNLTILDLSNNNIESIEALKNLTKITNLNISDNEIVSEDLGEIENLKSLEVFYAENCNLYDISKITSKKLKDINLSNNYIDEISSLNNNKDLISINLSNNNIKDISSLSASSNLKNLNVGENIVNNNGASVVKNFNKLENLNISNGSITSIDTLKNLTMLKGINLDGNKILDLSPLNNKQKLEVLSLSDCNINNNQLKSINSLNNLKEIDISNNNITSIESLNNSKNIVYLDVSENEIKDISSLSQFNKLEDLDISNNPIENNKNNQDVINNMTNNGVEVSNKKDVISVEEITLDKSEIEISIGEKTILNKDITPYSASNKNVTWKSSNPSVVSVDKEGNITGISKGQAIITVTTEEGNKKAECKVIVKGGETLLGDMDDNGKVNSFDALKILQISSRGNITEEEKKVADINKDGKVNSLDALKVLQYATGKIDKLE